MGLREDAIAAAAAAAEAREETARGVLADVLAPSEVDDLELVATLSTKLVFCSDNVCLSVGDQGTAGALVKLVANDQGWTYKGDVTSLAALGVLLARETA